MLFRSMLILPPIPSPISSHADRSKCSFLHQRAAWLRVSSVSNTLFLCVVVLRGLFLWSPVALALNQASDDNTYFENNIRPLFHAHCLECHHQGKRSGGLALDSKAGWEIGGESGPAIVPGSPDESLLMRTIRHTEAGLEMPAKAPKLEAPLIRAVETWIRDGARDPRLDPEPIRKNLPRKWELLYQERSQWWSFRPMGQTPIGDASASTPETFGKTISKRIDTWIDHGIQARSIQASGMADPVTLIRRASFQLRGLPPSPDEVKRFLSRWNQIDPMDSDALDRVWEETVDFLLGTREYAEHWARHWMDMVRYAETHGSEDDAYLPFVYRYRDYLVRAFERDIPIRDLIREQIAGEIGRAHV